LGLTLWCADKKFNGDLFVVKCFYRIHRTALEGNIKYGVVSDGRNLAPTPPGRSVGAPGNVQARGLNPAQPSDQKYAAGSGKVPYCM